MAGDFFIFTQQREQVLELNFFGNDLSGPGFKLGTGVRTDGRFQLLVETLLCIGGFQANEESKTIFSLLLMTWHTQY